MGFIENIIAGLGLGETPAEPLFKAVLYGDGAIYLQNVGAVKSYSPDKIELRLKNGGLTLTGTGLTIRKYCEGDLVVCGKIKTLSRN